jgi:hypothetical protein
MKMQCFSKTCKGKTTEHKWEPDKDTHHSQSTSSCRGIASDYRFMRCSECSHGQEWDFATD